MVVVEDALWGSYEQAYIFPNSERIELNSQSRKK